jgi:AcrR family transcriptional regulator
MNAREGRGGARRRAGHGVGSGDLEGSGHARRAVGGAGVGQERVSAIQRSRMLAALVEVAGERGVGRVSVAHIVERAGISRRTFYELFEDREDCFLAAFDHALARAMEAVVPAYEVGGGWRERVRAGLTALLGFLDEEPGLGALLVVDALGAGPRALERRERVLDALSAVVGGGGRGGNAARDNAVRESSPLAAEGVVGAVFSVLHARLLKQRAQVSAAGAARGVEPRFLGLVNPLMSMIVMPYLGTAAARRELGRPVPVRHAVKRTSLDPLRDLDMRLTYRTVRVLIAIATNPGASNRRIAESAEVSDQGQISKLLTRLEHLGLVENVGEGPVKGEPNAWTLTARGEQVEQAISLHTQPGEKNDA